MKHTGKFGQFGGVFVAETLMPALEELEQSYKKLKKDKAFKKELKQLLEEYAGRPTPLTYCEHLSNIYSCNIYLKREDLTHTGAHKINNALAQALLAKYMGKKNIIAETGAGQHGVAVATACAKLGMKAHIYMGSVDMKRQELNVFKMRLLGADVIAAESGTRTLKDAINDAIRQWTARAADTYYLLGSALGPHPYPTIVRDFQKIIGQETKQQIKKAVGRLPDHIVACVGGGSNAIGIFYDFIKDTDVSLIGVEAGGYGIHTGKHAARFSDPDMGRVGIIHGTLTYVLQDRYGQIYNTHSISAGLDYCAVGPEHSYLKDLQRAQYVSVTDDEALEAFRILSEQEGIIPALESSHAVAYALKLAERSDPEEIIIVNLSGRGDKDMEQIQGKIEL